jgi:hypothetical protein
LINKNCKAALQKLKKDNERVLWAGSICIDQSSDSERGRQVGIMASIYRNALEAPICDIDGEAGQQVSDVFTDFLDELVCDMIDLEHKDQSPFWSSKY